MLTAQNMTDLATALENRNPYSFLNAIVANQGMFLQDGWTPPGGGTPQGGWDTQIEEDSYEGSYWKFKDRSLRVRKAIRIPYDYWDEHGNRVREYLLIGFEGSSGD